MTTATLTSPSAASSSSAARARGHGTSSATSPIPRSSSLAFPRVSTSTIRLPWTFPRRVIASVVIAFRTIFVAVPALRRVLPAITSGPVSTRIDTSASSGTSSAGTHARKIVAAPTERAYARAPCTNGVVPPAAMPSTTSSGPTPRSSSA
jgi:hypothetical protein